MKKTNIVLIGASGCGKTSIGKRLAELRDMDFIDTDALIEDAAGMRITEIFAAYGEPRFREMETEAIKKAAAQKNAVIATGGGCVLFPENMAALGESGVTVYLKCEPEHIYENIKDDTARPLMQTDDKLGRIKEMLENRAPLYEKYADITAEIKTREVSDAAREITDLLN